MQIFENIAKKGGTARTEKDSRGRTHCLWIIKLAGKNGILTLAAKFSEAAELSRLLQGTCSLQKQYRLMLQLSNTDPVEESLHVDIIVQRTDQLNVSLLLLFLTKALPVLVRELIGHFEITSR